MDMWEYEDNEDTIEYFNEEEETGRLSASDPVTIEDEDDEIDFMSDDSDLTAQRSESNKTPKQPLEEGVNTSAKSANKKGKGQGSSGSNVKNNSASKSNGNHPETKDTTHLETSNEDYKKSLDEMALRLEAKDKKLSSLEASLTAKESYIEDLKRQVADTSAKASALDKEIKKRDKEIESLKAKDNSNEINALEEHIKELEAASNDLNKELKTRDKMIKDLSGAVKKAQTANKEIEDLKGKLKTVTEERDEACCRAEEAEANIKSVNSLNLNEMKSEFNRMMTALRNVIEETRSVNYKSETSDVLQVATDKIYSKKEVEEDTIKLLLEVEDALLRDIRGHRPHTSNDMVRLIKELFDSLLDRNHKK